MLVFPYMTGPKYKAVIFDFDDTLVESRAQKWAQHKHVAKKFFNIDLTEEEILKHWGKPIHTMAPELYQNKDVWENIYPILTSTRGDFHKKIYEGSTPVINKILKKGLSVGILSSATSREIKVDLERLNLPVDKFSFVQGVEDTLVHKPDPGVFLPALEQLSKEGINKEEIVYVGDSLFDLESAKGAGIDFIAVTTGLYSMENFRKAGANVIIENIKEVLKEIL